MFERSRTENPSDKREKAITVELSMDDGRILKGHIFTAATRRAYEELNSAGGFIDFQPYDGERELISKAAVRAVRLTDVAKANQLRLATGSEEFNPYAVLNLPRGADWKTIRETYHRLSKLYHPDRYANLDLPAEVKTYIDTMSRRLNAAFSALEKPHQVQREFARAKSEPIYQRG
jgi:DnaJ-domain-containing protein 1